MLSKACIIGAYQRKLEELASIPGVELTVIVPPYWREGDHAILLERLYTHGYDLIIEEMALNGHFHLHFYPRLARHFIRLHPDIVHVDEEPYNLATWQAMHLAVSTGARGLFFTWQNILRRYPPPFCLFERYNFAHAAHAIAGNHEAVEVLRAKGYKGPIQVIPQFGVDPQLYRPMRIKGGEEPFTIGYVGRLVEEKGIRLLVETVAGLEGDWQLSIVGEGPQRSVIERLSHKLGIANCVHFQRHIPSIQMPAHLNSLDVLVLPSLTKPNWKEQFGRVLIEAMACEVPVIGSDSGEIPHVIGDAGLVFPEGDVVALRNHLRRLMDEPEIRRQLGQRGRARVLAHYTQARIAQETYQVYQGILAEG